MIKKENGLTLIALIITIIVMVILAGVSLSLTTGDNGVLNKAKLAKEETRAGQIRDIRDIWFSDKQIAEEIGGESELLRTLVNRLIKDGLLTDEEGRKILDTEEVQIGNQTISFMYERNNTGNGTNQNTGLGTENLGNADEVASQYAKEIEETLKYFTFDKSTGILTSRDDVNRK